jgi:hypothetical protein
MIPLASLIDSLGGHTSSRLHSMWRTIGFQIVLSVFAKQQGKTLLFGRTRE